MVNNFLKVVLFSWLLGSTIPARTQELGKVERFKKEIAHYITRLDSTDSTLLSSVYWRIGNYYDSLGLPSIAIDYYRKGSLSWIPSRVTRRNRNAIPLADHFLKEKQFDSALYYLQYRYKSNYPRLRTGHPIFWDTDISYRIMLAYNSLGFTEKAINAFLPYAFLEWTNADGTKYDTAHLYTNDYHCQLRDFLKIVAKKYSESYISELFCELRNPRYLEISDSSGKKCYVTSQLWFKLLGVDMLFIELTNECEGLKEPGMSEPKHFLMEEFSHTLLYMWAIGMPKCNSL